jgi:hypothetical protein
MVSVSISTLIIALFVNPGNPIPPPYPGLLQGKKTILEGNI